jgi:hypothetical protein
MTNDPVAVVTQLGCGRVGTRWDLRTGESLTFGRSASVDIVLDSPMISRYAGVLFAGPTFLAVTRARRLAGPPTGNLWVNAFDADGPVLLRPGGTVAIDSAQSEIHATVVDPSRSDVTDYARRVDKLFGTPLLRVALRTSTQLLPDQQHLGSNELTIPSLEEFRRDPDHRLLVILCAPLFDYVGHNGDLPTNVMIANTCAALGTPLAWGTVRNRLHEWKQKLGISGSANAGVSHYQLALLARAAGLVTESDVDEFHRHMPGGR